MKALFFITVGACASATSTQDVSPRRVTADETQCELQGVSVRDYEESDGKSRWNASCYGRTFVCHMSGDSAACTLDERASADASVSTEVLVRRFNSCHGGQQVACHALAEDYELGKNGIPPNRFTAIELYGVSCKLGSKRDCVRGQMLQKASRGSSR